MRVLVGGGFSRDLDEIAAKSPSHKICLVSKLRLERV